jgi:hypothetical protein
MLTYQPTAQNLNLLDKNHRLRTADAISIVFDAPSPLKPIKTNRFEIWNF